VQLKDKLKQDFQIFKKMTATSVQQFHCIQMNREPLSDYLRRFVQKKAQTPNFSESTTIEKFIDGLLPSFKGATKNLVRVYVEVEKYTKSDADHKRRVEQRKLMRQQQNCQQGNQNNTNQQHQYIFPVEPS